MYQTLYIYILILIIIAIIVALAYYLYKNVMSYNSLIHDSINEFTTNITNDIITTTNNTTNNTTNTNNTNNNTTNTTNNNIDDKYKYLYKPVEYYKGQKGKNMRNHIANFIGTYFNIDKALIDDAANYTNELHNSSLIIDDIQDGSLKRRETDCAHIVYGMPVSLSSAYLNIFKVLSDKSNNNNEMLIDTNKFRQLDIYSNLDDVQIKQLVNYKCLQNMLKNAYLAHLGQAMDIYWANNKVIPSEEEYYFMINAKTGLGFTGSLDLFYNMSTNISDQEYDKFTQLLTKFSQFFQIRDDYINLTDPDFWAKKGFCEDFDEKKYSYLIIKYNNNLLVSKEEKQEFFDLFYKCQLTNQDKSALIKKLDDVGIFKETYQLLTELKSEVNAVIDLEFIFDMLPITPFNIDLIKEYC